MKTFKSTSPQPRKANVWSTVLRIILQILTIGLYHVEKHTSDEQQANGSPV
jgi:hypothetical protein